MTRSGVVAAGVGGEGEHARGLLRSPSSGPTSAKIVWVSSSTATRTLERPPSCVFGPSMTRSGARRGHRPGARTRRCDWDSPRRIVLVVADDDFAALPVERESDGIVELAGRVAAPQNAADRVDAGAVREPRPGEDAAIARDDDHLVVRAVDAHGARLAEEGGFIVRKGARRRWRARRKRGWPSPEVATYRTFSPDSNSMKFAVLTGLAVPGTIERSGATLPLAPSAKKPMTPEVAWFG
jgi:hypothetical protein